MKVKIGNKIYDSDDEPILIILSDNEKELVTNMDDDNDRLCSFPKGYPIEETEKFMEQTDIYMVVHNGNGKLIGKYTDGWLGNNCLGCPHFPTTKWQFNGGN